MKALLPLLFAVAGCEWGPFYDCGDVDEDAVRALAVDRGVLDVYSRLDVFCEPRADVAVDCRNDTAESCLAWRGSTFSRARIYASSEASEGLLPLLEHEFAAHAKDPPDGDACAQHPPSCDGKP